MDRSDIHRTGPGGGGHRLSPGPEPAAPGHGHHEQDIRRGRLAHEARRGQYLAMGRAHVLGHGGAPDPAKGGHRDADPAAIAPRGDVAEALPGRDAVPQRPPGPDDHGGGCVVSDGHPSAHRRGGAFGRRRAAGRTLQQRGHGRDAGGLVRQEAQALPEIGPALRPVGPADGPRPAGGLVYKDEDKEASQ